MLLALLLQSAEIGPPPACSREERSGGTVMLAYVGDRACVPLAEPRTYEGVWLDEFERQAFVADARTVADALAARERPWFNTSDPLKPFTRPRRARGHAYRVRFVGREARDMHRPPLQGYGHMSLSPGLVVLDEMVEVADLGPIRSYNPR